MRRNRLSGEGSFPSSRLCTKSRRNISDSHSPICNPQQRYAITVSDKPKESLRILPIFVQYRGLRVADLGLRTETRFRLFVQSPVNQHRIGSNQYPSIPATHPTLQ